jgi:hypothetical protein
MSEIEAGDVVMARGSSGTFYAVARGIRLNRVVVERCDGRPSGPIAIRDVTAVFKNAGRPEVDTSHPQRVRPTTQMRLDLDS